MSIIVSVKVRDGIVLGADGMSQIYIQDKQGRTGVAQTYKNARKLFEVANIHMGIMAYGAGNIGKRSVQGVIEDFSEKIRTTEPKSIETVEQVTQKLFTHINEQYEEQLSSIDPAQRPLVGVFVAGYSKDQPSPEEWEFQIPANPKVRRVRDISVYGASWRGVALPFTRLNMGIDPRIIAELVKKGVDKKIIDEAANLVKSQIMYDAMPVQDAIDFASHILRTTIVQTTFEVGPPSCGGPLDIAIISKVDGFQWVNKRQLTI